MKLVSGNEIISIKVNPLWKDINLKQRNSRQFFHRSSSSFHRDVAKLFTCS